MGARLPSLSVDKRRLRLCLLVISGFLAGGMTGALSFQSLGYGALAIPSGLAIAASGFALIWRDG